MTKDEIIAKAADDADITKTQADSALKSILNSIEGALAKNDKVSLIGFGTFSVSKRAARQGRNPATGATIRFELAVPRAVELSIVTSAGRVVRRLASGRVFGPGDHELTFDGTDGRGGALPSGTYFARLAAGGTEIQLAKLVVVR